MVIRPLAHEDFDAVLAAFNEAFSDYVVPLSLTRAQLEEMLTRRGWVPELSVGIFDEGRMVAFTLNALDGHAAYDTGTGVLPTHRRRGFGRQMMELSMPPLRNAGVTRYVLEVIETNEKAIPLYRDVGFTVTRRLQCWSFNPDGDDTAPLLPASYRIPPEEWWTVQPAWQNSVASIRRARDRYAVIGDDDGAAVVFPSNGDLPLLAVRPDARRQGFGSSLLRAAAALAGKPLRIINVDDRDEAITRFLEANGAKRTLAQFEMELAL